MVKKNHIGLLQVKNIIEIKISMDRLNRLDTAEERVSDL